MQKQIDHPPDGKGSSDFLQSFVKLKKLFADKTPWVWTSGSLLHLGLVVCIDSYRSAAVGYVGFLPALTLFSMFGVFAGPEKFLKPGLAGFKYDFKKKSLVKDLQKSMITEGEFGEMMASIKVEYLIDRYGYSGKEKAAVSQADVAEVEEEFAKEMEDSDAYSVDEAGPPKPKFSSKDKSKKKKREG